MNLTETWFDNTVEYVVQIDRYNIFKGEDIVREGTANYLHDKLEAIKICDMSYKNVIWLQ